MIADKLLSHLDKVQKTGPGTWQACCPSHDDRQPSLSIREADDGRILLHCFGGCSAHEVVGAIGLELSDLFPPTQQRGKFERRPFPAMDALRAVTFEMLVVVSVSNVLRNGQPLSDTDHERLITACARISGALSAVAPTLRGVRHG